MASTRELWVVLRGRDEASRVVHSFARNVQQAGKSVEAAQMRSRAAALRQQATMLKGNSIAAQAVRQAQMHTLSLDRQARALTYESAVLKQNRDQLSKQIGVSSQAKRTLDNRIRSIDLEANRIRANAAQWRTWTQTVSKELDVQVRKLNNQAMAIDRSARALEDAERKAVKHRQALQKLSVGMQQTSDVAGVMAFSFGAAAAASGVFLGSAVKDSLDYQHQVRATATQVDKFALSIKDLGDVGIRIADQIGVHFEGIQPALFDIFSSMEVNIQTAEKLLESFSKAAVAGGVEIQDVSRATIGILNSFNLPASKVNHILDIQFQLIKEGIGTYEEWNQRIGLVTPSAVRFGQSVETMAAALAVSTRMGLSAARSGTAVARAMDALSHPKAVKNMEQLGIKVRDAHGAFLPMNQILRQFRDVLNKMPKKDRVAAILDVFKGAGGTIEARRFLQNILLGAGNLELFDKILQDTQKSAGSMEGAYKVMADSTANKSELLRNKFKILKIAIGDALIPSLNDLIDHLSSLLDWFNKLPSGTKKTIANLLLISTIVAGIGAVFFAVIAVIGLIVSAFVTAGTAILVTFGILGLITGVAATVAAGFGIMWEKSDSFRRLLSHIKDNALDLWDTLKQFGEDVAAEFKEHLLPALQDLWKEIDEEVIPTITDFYDTWTDKVLPKIKEAVRIIKDELVVAMVKIKDVIENDIIPTLHKMADWYQKNKDDIDRVATAAGFLLKILLIVMGFLTSEFIVTLAKLAAALLKVAAKMLELQSVVNTGVKVMIDRFLDLVGTVLHGAAKAFGWVPDMGGQLKAAAREFDKFRDRVNRALNGIHDTTVRVNVDVETAIKMTGGKHGFGGGLASGGLVKGIGTATSDSNLYALSKGEYVLPAKVVKRIGINNLNRMVQGTTMRAPSMSAPMGFVSQDATTRSVQPAMGGTGRTVIQQFYITTQEIDPTKHAADLGWELQGRM